MDTLFGRHPLLICFIGVVLNLVAVAINAHDGGWAWVGVPFNLFGAGACIWAWRRIRRLKSTPSNNYFSDDLEAWIKKDKHDL